MTSGLLAANVRLLRQAESVLGALDRSAFAGGAAGRGSVGSHLRHCLDFYDAFLHGLATGTVDYGDHAHEARTEKDPAVALARIEGTVHRLEAQDVAHWPGTVEVRLLDALEGEAEVAESTPERELQMLLGHTEHHYALIAFLLQQAGHAVPGDFGVAKATLPREAKPAR
ncbi:MAG: DinB family protein [bacterium]